jgi:excisionase family DNA binding protein
MVPVTAAYTADQVAELLQTSTDRVYQMAREGRIPHVRLGKRSIRFPRHAFHAWLDGGAWEPQNPPRRQSGAESWAAAWPRSR